MSKELMQLALNAYNEFDYNDFLSVKKLENVMRSIQTELTKPEPKKAIVLRGQRNKTVGIYMEDGEEIARAELPHKKWVGLTDEDLSVCDEDGVILARYWEAKLREKNT